MNIIKNIIFIILTIFAVILFFLITYQAFSYQMFYTEQIIYFMTILYCISVTVMTVIKISNLYNEKQLRKWIRAYIISLFMLYIVFMIAIRYPNLTSNLINIKYVSADKMNFIPFKTISYYISKHNQHYITTREFLTNTLGNVVIFAPLGLFLPVLFKKLHKIGWFALTYISICIISELLQWFTLNGSFDVDDIILQIIGGMVVYTIYRLPIIQKLLLKMDVINQQSHTANHQVHTLL